jgi:hypothetical protein
MDNIGEEISKTSPKGLKWQQLEPAYKLGCASTSSCIQALHLTVTDKTVLFVWACEFQYPFKDRRRPIRFYCNSCNQVISRGVYDFSRDKFGIPLCMNCQGVKRSDLSCSSTMKHAIPRALRLGKFQKLV